MHMYSYVCSYTTVVRATSNFKLQQQYVFVVLARQLRVLNSCHAVLISVGGDGAEQSRQVGNTGNSCTGGSLVP